MKKINSNKVFDVVNYTLLILIVLIMLYPIYFVLIASFSDPQAAATGQVVLWVKDFSLDSYSEIFKNEKIWIGYRNSIIYTASGTFLSLCMLLPAAYSLSKKYLPFRSIIMFYFFLTIYVSGGMLPGYILVKNLGLLNKPYTMIILGSGVSISNLIVSRTFFSNTIEASLYEAAEMDGCSEIGKFLKIAMPLSKPIVAVMALYCAVSNWNGYFTAMMYLNKSEYQPLQVVIKNILIEGQNILNNLNFENMSQDEILYALEQLQLAEAMKYSIIFIASLPMLIAYPFVQKHFVKGVMIGSVKG